MAQFRRTGETNRPQVAFVLDDEKVTALAGDTVLTAILTYRRHVRTSEKFRNGRAGLCLMGACQDCWIWTRGGERLRACSTLVQTDMALVSQSPFDKC